MVPLSVDHSWGAGTIDERYLDTPYYLAPADPGLSHLTEHLEQEIVVPAGAFELL
jgi:non-homologous end joining protein Ku